MATSGLLYGTELPDQIDPLNSVLEKQLSLLGDIRDLVRERAALEKEYSQKLQAIARRAAEKRAKSAIPRIVGEDPSKAYGDDIQKRNTLEAAYAMLIEAYDTSAQDHASFSDALTNRMVQDLKILEQKKDATRRKQLAAFHKTLQDRDKTYGERVRARQKYNEECMEIEIYRQKQSHAADDKHAERAAKQYEQQKVEMMNSKNIFIISTAVANKVKDKFYTTDLPALENQFQEIQASLTTGLISIFKTHQALHTAQLDGLKYKIGLVDTAIAAFDPQKDQELFIEHNKRLGYSKPPDWGWEPCQGYYDSASGDICVDPEPKVFLQNKLARAQTKLEEVKSQIKVKGHDASQLQTLYATYSGNPKLGDADEVMNNYLDAQHNYMQLTTIEIALEGEAEVIVGALGDDQGARQPHNFKSSSFSIPTPCAFCKSSIWGLSKQGKSCKACGIAVHAKCELKLPAECPGVAGKKPRSSFAVSAPKANMPSAGGSRLSVATAESSATPTPTISSITSAMPVVHATILFDFKASSAFELSVTEGATVEILEDDDGSGWAKVKDSTGKSGLVPASYVELSEGGGPRSATPPPVYQATRPQGSGRFVKGIYEYVAQGDDEIAVRVSGRIELTPVGESYGDGWSEGIDEATGKKGIFPSNYVEPA